MTDEQRAEATKFPKAHIQARRVQALELRKQGYTYRTIADTMSINVSTAYYAVQDSLQVLRDLEMERAEDVRGIEMERLDRLLLGVWDKAVEGDDRAVRSALSIMERRARLMGLDAPTKAEHTGEVTFVELARTIADQADRLSGAGVSREDQSPDQAQGPYGLEDA